MTLPHPIVFLVDVDNTLVDNDAIQQDLKDHLGQTYGIAARDRYWTILEGLMVELGYRDYIGALQRFRVVHDSVGKRPYGDRGLLLNGVADPIALSSGKC